jgi:carbonic anhydrase
MKAVLHPEKAKGLPCVSKWLQNGIPARERVLSEKLPKHLQLKALTERNVVVQLENLLTYPVVAAKLKAGKLKIAGWVYDIEHGKVLGYDPGTGTFSVLRV